MNEFPLVANRESPSLPEVGNDIDGHTRILRAVRECVMIGERRTKNLLSSFVRVHEIVDLGIAEVQGGRLVVATDTDDDDGGAPIETTVIGIAAATVEVTDSSDAVIPLAVVGGRVFEVQVFVTDEFVDSGAALTVGDASDNDRLFTLADSMLGSEGNSVSHIGAMYFSDTQLNIYYSAAGATVGQAFVSVIYEAFDEITAVSGGGGGGGTVDSVVDGTGIDIDSTDPANPIINLDAASIASLALANSSLQSLSAGTGAAVDNTDPQNPVVSVIGGTGTEVSQGTNLVITSNNVFQVTNLTVPLVAGSYRFEIWLWCDVNATPDMEVQLQYSGTAPVMTGHRYASRNSPAAVSDAAVTGVGAGSTYNMNENSRFFVEYVGFLSVSDSGNFAVYARQVTSSGTSVTFLAQCNLRITRVL